MHVLFIHSFITYNYSQMWENSTSRPHRKCSYILAAPGRKFCSVYWNQSESSSGQTRTITCDMWLYHWRWVFKPTDVDADKIQILVYLRLVLLALQVCKSFLRRSLQFAIFSYWNKRKYIILREITSILLLNVYNTLLYITLLVFCLQYKR